MIKTIIDYNNAKLELLGYFQKVFGLVTYVTESGEEQDKIYPAIYCGDGEFNHVTQYDYECGLAYWKKTGDIRYAESTSESLIGAKRLVTVTYPLQLIISIKKDKLSVDDQYASERVANSIAKVLNDNNGSLKTGLQARKVIINQTGMNDKVDDVFRQEMQNVDLNYSYTYLLMAISFDVTVEINQACLTQECAYPVYECDILSNLVSAQNRRDCILPEFDFSTDEDFDALSEQQILDLTNRLCN